MLVVDEVCVPVGTGVFAVGGAVVKGASVPVGDGRLVVMVPVATGASVETVTTAVVVRPPPVEVVVISPADDPFATVDVVEADDEVAGDDASSVPQASTRTPAAISVATTAAGRTSNLGRPKPEGVCDVELFEVMRRTPSCRYFEERPVPDAVLHRILDHARFASSGGNRQGWRVVVITDPEVKAKIADLHRRQWSAYIGAARQGTVGYQGDESGHKMEHGTESSARRLDRTDDFSANLHRVPALLVIYTMLDTLAITDKELDRPSVVGGGSVYTFVQNLLLGCTAEGLGSALTTLLAAEQPEVDDILGAPPGAALAALIAVGYPEPGKQYTRLRRNPVTDFAFRDGFATPWQEPQSG